jgi:hypothetical protein
MAGGWVWSVQRIGRYTYKRVLAHTTKPNHLGPTAPPPRDIPTLEVAPWYRRD